MRMNLGKQCNQMNKKSKTWFSRCESRLLFCLLAAFVVTGATAVEPASRPFSVHDRDQDGVLSRDEYAALLGRMQERQKQRDMAGRFHSPRLLDFDAVDANGDGRITEEELGAALESQLERQRGYRHHRER
ncbi:MAG: EF-hand domain-containing protein [Gammaproteobacteria bacterium]|nr:EF-hand domain-containing protein [Gammaproteobacteria bacterium]